jgi:hypothetical protein
MKHIVIALLLCVGTLFAGEVGFPEGKISRDWNVDIGKEFGGTLTRCYQEYLPDGKPAICLQGLFEHGGTYCILSRAIKPCDFNGVEIEVARGNFRLLRIRLTDETGQTFMMQYELKGAPQEIVKMTCTIENGVKAAVYGGANDGKWHGKLTRLGLLADSGVAESGNRSPKIYFRSVKLLEK